MSLFTNEEKGPYDSKTLEQEEEVDDEDNYWNIHIVYFVCYSSFCTGLRNNMSPCHYQWKNGRR
jgi:hypothetical protein